jgi:osmoprotectant transport system permease protein
MAGSVVIEPTVGTNLPSGRTPDDSGQERSTGSIVKSIFRWGTMPVLLALVLLATYLYVTGRELDAIEARVLNRELLTRVFLEHVRLAAASTTITILLAVPAGILVTRPTLVRYAPVVTGFANAGQAIPSLGLLTLIVVATSVGFRSAVIALVAYAFLPILRNTIVGLEQVDQNLVDAARGMGLSPNRVLRQVEMPLAIPVILTGIRTALIINIGTATLAFLFGAGGLGFVIFQGIQLNREPVLVTGIVLASGLALAVDYLASVAQHVLKPRGL